MYIHSLDPFAIQFTETFGIRWYGLAYLSGFVFGYLTCLWLIRKGRSALPEADLADFVTFMAIGVLAGGRLGYCLFYAPDLLVSWDSQFPFWGALKVNEGGMASHGGIFGVMLVCWFYAKRKKLPFLHVLDLTAIGGSIGFFFGRIANFINGELYGRVAPEGTWWAVKFPQEMLLWPKQEFNRLVDLGAVMDNLGSMQNSLGERIQVNAEIWQNWLNNYYGRDGMARQNIYAGIEDLIQATQAGNAEVIQALGPLLSPRYPSQLVQSVLEGLLVFLALLWIWRKPQKPGVVGGWFGVLYCIARIIGEQFRMPDSHIGFQLFGLTRGQWISIGFLAFAMGYLIVAYRRKTPQRF